MPASVYSIRHRQTGREYIGVTSRDISVRWTEHRNDAKAGRGHAVHRALRKCGVEAFDWRVEATLPSYPEARIAEQILIAVRGPAYNLTAGGEGLRGYAHSSETCEKISRGLKASAKLKEANRRSGDIRRGRKFSEAHCQALSVARKLRAPFSEQTRAKLRAARLGKKQTPEAIAKMLASRRANRCR